MSKSILITGATGFVGKYLTQHLSKTYSVLTLNRHPRKGNDQLTNYEFKKGVAVNVDHFVGVHTVIHCMGVAHKKIHKSQSYLEEINVGLTVQIANAAIKAKVKKFIYISTANVYEKSTEEMEKYFPNTDCKPDESYAISKLRAEMKLQKIFHASDSKLIIIRPPLMYGDSKFKGNLRLLEILIRLRIPLPFGLLSAKRSYLSLENLCSFIKVCIESEFSCDMPFLLRDQKRMTLKEIAEVVSKAISINVKFFNMNLITLKFILTLVLGNRIAKKFFHDFDIDQKLTIEITGWHPKDCE